MSYILGLIFFNYGKIFYDMKRCVWFQNLKANYNNTLVEFFNIEFVV